jgi:exopolysaccharide biosynthesis polyprenyl glycosylphosphotransferase
MGLVTFALKLEVSRPVFFLFFVLTTILLALNRIVLISVLRSRNISEHNQIRILVVGGGEKARRVGEVLGNSEKWGYRIIGYVIPNGKQEDADGINVIGSTKELPRLLEETVIDEVIFCSPRIRDGEAVDEILRLCAELGIKTRVTTDILPVSGSRVSLEFLDSLPLITFSSGPEHDLSLVLKRIMDFTIAAVSLTLLSPLMLLTAFLIKFTSPGPVFYTQVRCGLFGRKFGLTKFRTMIDGAEDKLWEIRHLNEMDGPVFKMRNDPRVTPLGRILRKASIDELPQLWNVIKGEMSIVGPRAPLVEEVSHYSNKQRRRLSVKPGITCLWQVSGRNEVNFQRWMDMDLEYIDNWSVWLDLTILVKTIPAVLSGRGAR